MIRLLPLCALVMILGGCGVLRLGSGPSGLDIVGKSAYCGTASQTSEVHYFADSTGFANWLSYRNIDDFNPKMARSGLLIVEMGQRPTGGYKLVLDGDKSRIAGDTLNIFMDWHAPRLDDAVSQAMITQCVAISLPRGQYDHIRVVDQIGNVRGDIDLSKSHNS